MTKTNGFSKLLFTLALAVATVVGFMPMKAFAADATLIQNTDLVTSAPCNNIGFFILFTFAMVGTCIMAALNRR